MQNYQLFWNSEITGHGHGQLVVDWDLFIRNFTIGVSTYAHYQLNETQKEYIKTKIDPLQTNQIYKNAFLLFAKQYWDLPSNRTNLFKMKINLSTIPRLQLLTGSSPQMIRISFSYRAYNGELMNIRYLYREDRLYGLDGCGFEMNQKQVLQKGFISIGGGEENDIDVDDCVFLNRNHFKLIRIRSELQRKKKSIFEENEPKPIVVTSWFIRDISKSNRLRYMLDTEYKYVIVKPLMVMGIGLTEDYEIRITKIGFEGGNILVPKMLTDQIITILNNDRINFMGEIDESVPLKTVLDLDLKEVTVKEIQAMYEQGQYYPHEILSNSSAKEANNKETPSLTFEIINKRNLSCVVYVSKDVVFTVGRSEQCTYRIDDIGIRGRELIFQCISNVWTVRSAKTMIKTNLEVNVPGVYLSSFKNIKENRNSNRVQLKEGAPYVLRGREFESVIELIEGEKEEEY